MTRYRRPRIEGATWFFTVNCAERHGDRISADRANALCAGFRAVKRAHPFTIDTIVLLPDHLHRIWTLPPGDADCTTRWALIKAGFSRASPDRHDSPGALAPAHRQSCLPTHRPALLD